MEKYSLRNRDLLVQRSFRQEGLHFFISQAFIYVNFFLVPQQQFVNYNMLGEKKQNGIWRRYSYLFNKHKNINLQCFCGKCYYSFPALYLHCQRKHSKKISTSLFKEQCQEARIQKGHLLTYLLQEDGNLKQIESPDKCEKIKAGKKILGQFEEYLIQKRQGKAQSKQCIYQSIWESKILKSIEKFVAQNVKNSEGDTSTFVHEIPYLFNNYMANAEINSQQEYDTLCQLLIQFGNWMKNKEYTTLTTIRNQSDEVLPHDF